MQKEKLRFGKLALLTIAVISLLAIACTAYVTADDDRDRDPRPTREPRETPTPTPMPVPPSPTPVPPTPTPTPTPVPPTPTPTNTPPPDDGSDDGNGSGDDDGGSDPPALADITYPQENQLFSVRIGEQIAIPIQTTAYPNPLWCFLSTRPSTMTLDDQECVIRWTPGSEYNVGQQYEVTFYIKDTPPGQQGREKYGRFFIEVLAANDDPPDNPPPPDDDPPAGAPAAPSNLIASPSDTPYAFLTWNDNSSDENGFSIDRRTGSGSFSQIATQSQNLNFYTDNSVAFGTTYCYRVRSFNGSGNSSWSNEDCATIPGSDGSDPCASAGQESGIIAGILNFLGIGKDVQTQQCQEPTAAIDLLYDCIGGNSSWLGSATSGPYTEAATGKPRQDFQNGYIAWNGAQFYTFSNRAGDTFLAPLQPVCVQGLNGDKLAIAKTYNRIGGGLKTYSAQHTMDPAVALGVWSVESAVEGPFGGPSEKPTIRFVKYPFLRTRL